ncbi:molybdopterin molybdotransferase MoeA [Aestuariimicrobium ganziense]|uniref:molybdopterin molybdotransferase MoeA n=1 Tax=Aestuariimicrobium ganziense TaxID=2773677 RepID=UPI0019458E81|nr:gephyrin-like molybdotransferase Glp [Aestuariimicrobium ganziense]
MALFQRKKRVVVDEVVEQRPPLPDPPAPNADGLRSMDDHRHYLLSLVEPLPPFGMALLDAVGLALCEDITSPLALPRHPISHMAGYAVVADDIAEASADEPASLTVVNGEVSPGQAGIVHEQGRVPDGADTVVPLASTDRGEQTVRVFAPVEAGSHLRSTGSDVTVDAPLATAGQLLNDRSVGLLAGVGIDKVLARPRPRVVVVSQGADLVEPGRDLRDDDDLHDATGVLVAAAAKQAGCQVWRVSVNSADPAELSEAITDQLIRADLVLTTGGALDPDNHVLRGVLADLGQCDTAEVAIRPGRSQVFALVGDDRVPLVVLPTNPVAAHASFHAFVWPMLRKLAGAHQVEQAKVRTYPSTVVRSPLGLTSIQRAVVHDEGGRHRVELIPHTPDDQLAGLARCNALAVIDEDVEFVNAGEPIGCWLLEGP